MTWQRILLSLVASSGGCCQERARGRRKARRSRRGGAMLGEGEHGVKVGARSGAIYRPRWEARFGLVGPNMRLIKQSVDNRAWAFG